MFHKLKNSLKNSFLLVLPFQVSKRISNWNVQSDIHLDIQLDIQIARRADFMFLVSQRRSSIKRIFFDSQFLNSQVNSSAITKHEVCRLGDVQMDVKMKILKFDIQLDFQLDVHLDIHLDIQLDVQLDVQLDIHFDIYFDIQLDIQMDVQMDVQLDIRLDIQLEILSLTWYMSLITLVEKFEKNPFFHQFISGINSKKRSFHTTY